MSRATRYRKKLQRQVEMQLAERAVTADVSLLTVAEVAAAWRVTEQTVRSFCRDGRLPAIRTGRQWRVLASALAAGTEQ